MYSVGDYVVKANNGVCRIEDIRPLEGGERGTLYYVLIPQEERNARLYVPVDGKGTPLRSVLDAKSAWSIIERVPEIATEWIANDKQREQEYRETLRSCDPELLVGMIKNIYQRKCRRREQGKKSTALDDRYVRLAEQALYSELAFATGREKDDVGQIVADAIRGEETAAAKI